MGYSPWVHKESDTTEQSTLSSSSSSSSSSLQLSRKERSMFNLGVPTVCEYCVKSWAYRRGQRKCVMATMMFIVTHSLKLGSY